jgi:hypothetical protein
MADAIGVGVGAGGANAARAALKAEVRRRVRLPGGGRRR